MESITLLFVDEALKKFATSINIAKRYEFQCNECSNSYFDVTTKYEQILLSHTFSVNKRVHNRHNLVVYLKRRKHQGDLGNDETRFIGIITDAPMNIRATILTPRVYFGNDAFKYAIR
eukprot:snap_masked-scaffold_1-processed-gene-4.51-mRNA-1 protein AED:1.00 eAED:1.00 QI:0/0/0/0/1/1/2/0/117